MQSTGTLSTCPHLCLGETLPLRHQACTTPICLCRRTRSCWRRGLCTRRWGCQLRAITAAPRYDCRVPAVAYTVHGTPRAHPQNPYPKLVGCVLEERQAWLVKGPCRPLRWAALALSPGRHFSVTAQRHAVSAGPTRSRALHCDHAKTGCQRTASKKQTCPPPLPICRPPPPRSSMSSAPTSCTLVMALCRSFSRPFARASLTRCAGGWGGAPGGGQRAWKQDSTSDVHLEHDIGSAWTGGVEKLLRCHLQGPSNKARWEGGTQATSSLVAAAPLVNPSSGCLRPCTGGVRPRGPAGVLWPHGCGHAQQRGGAVAVPVRPGMHQVCEKYGKAVHHAPCYQVSWVLLRTSCFFVTAPFCPQSTIGLSHAWTCMCRARQASRTVPTWRETIGAVTPGVQHFTSAFLKPVSISAWK